MTLRTRVLLWLLPAMVVLAVGQFWLLSRFITRDLRAANTVASQAQNSDNPAGQLATPIPPREYNNSLPVPSARVTPDMIQTAPNFHCFRVKCDIFKGSFTRLGFAAPQQNFDSCQYFRKRVGFDHIIIGTTFQTF